MGIGQNRTTRLMRGATEISRPKFRAVSQCKAIETRRKRLLRRLTDCGQNENEEETF